MKINFKFFIIISALFLFFACGESKPTTNTKIAKNDSKTYPYKTKNGIVFRFIPSHKTEGEVFLIGDFNGWIPFDKNLKMTKNKNGNYYITTKLSNGRYEYKFIVNGMQMADKNAKDTVKNPAGGEKSMFTVK